MATISKENLQDKTFQNRRHRVPVNSEPPPLSLFPKNSSRDMATAALADMFVPAHGWCTGYPQGLPKPLYCIITCKVKTHTYAFPIGVCRATLCPGRVCVIRSASHSGSITMANAIG